MKCIFQDMAVNAPVAAKVEQYILVLLAGGSQRPPDILSCICVCSIQLRIGIGRSLQRNAFELRRRNRSKKQNSYQRSIGDEFSFHFILMDESKFKVAEYFTPRLMRPIWAIRRDHILMRGIPDRSSCMSVPRSCGWPRSLLFRLSDMWSSRTKCRAGFSRR